MKRSAKLVALFGLLASGAAAQTDGLPPVRPQAIAEAAQSCAGVVSAAGVDEQRLAADGWVEGRMMSKGKEVASPLRFFGRGGAMLLLDGTPQKPSTSCIVMARIASAEDYQQVAQATQVALAGKPIKSDSGSVMWMLGDNKAAQLESTGSGKKPAVRVIVMQLTGNN